MGNSFEKNKDIKLVKEENQEQDLEKFDIWGTKEDLKDQECHLEIKIGHSMENDIFGEFDQFKYKMTSQNNS